jgi:8-oxo-dGTP pyrophosphatase MutT (NUDIX family)
VPLQNQHHKQARTRNKFMSSALLDFVQSSCTFDPSDTLIPFTVEGVLVGWMKRSFADHLNDWPELFSVRARGVGMTAQFESVDHRSAAMHEVVETLASQEVIHGWRDEQVTIAESFYSPPLFHIERAASRYFGFTVYASHLNGLTVRDGQPYMWLAKRAESKPIDPGLWDNLVAGRIGRSFSPLDTLYKECEEEAGIDKALSSQARAAGALRSKHEVEVGLHNEVVFLHDLILPESFIPQNQDGEVERFECVPIAEMVSRLANPAEFTVDAALVIIDCLLRRGYFPSNRMDYLDLIHALRP